jgi:uncharacterized protein YdeI (YjbR/CyaY-like superfamily)
MPPAKPANQDLPLLEVPDATAWERWLEQHPGSEGVWLKIAKRHAPTPTPTYAEALESALCFGWIDGQKGALDEHYWRQRFTPRKPRSKWSQRNTDLALQLIEQDRMRPAGMAQVEAARQDGRWEAAYESQASATVPPDFQAELDRNPRAKAFFATLTGSNRYAFLYRIQDAKRPQTRARRIATFVAMLDEGRTFYP